MIRKDFADRIACYQDDAHVHAMRAFEAGKASEHQQKLILTWLINSACRVNETTFWPGDPHASAFLEGRKSIAIDIRALIKAKLKEDASL